MQSVMVSPSIPFPSLRLALIAGLFASFCGVAALAAPSTQSNTYTKLVSDYMSGKWDDVQTNLKASSTQPSTFDARRRRMSITSGRRWPNAGPGGGDARRQATKVKATIFNIPITAMYDPQQKLGTNVHFTEDSTDVTVGWTFGDMDSDQPAEHGFSKGDLSNSGIWCTLGETAGYLQVPFQSLINLSDADKVKLTRSARLPGKHGSGVLQYAALPAMVVFSIVTILPASVSGIGNRDEPPGTGGDVCGGIGGPPGEISLDPVAGPGGCG